MAIDNIYDKGIADGWKVVDGQTLTESTTLEADVVIVGSGAGGATAADIFTKAGLQVLIIEAAGLQTSDDFKDMDEAKGYGSLYQEGGGRATSDGAVAVFQGRAVGGSTTVNWTTSLRTPDATLDHWVSEHGVTGLNGDDLKPWFDLNERQLNVLPWPVPNANNGILASGCEKLGYSYKAVPRNVKGCWNLGYCGLGCPTNAKQSMLVTRVPSALAGGATLLHRVNVQEIVHDGKQVSGLQAIPLRADNVTPTGATISLKAKHFVLAGGALNNPALMLRSNLPDPYGTLGARTTIHPVNVITGFFDKKIDGFWGAPQSIYSDQFLGQSPKDGEMAYKLEVAPMLPALMSSIMGGHGDELSDRMKMLPSAHSMIALLRDGFHPESQGGQVRIDDQGQPLLDYDMSDYAWDGIRRAFLSMAEVQFAAGANAVLPSHLDAVEYRNWNAAKAGINDLKYAKFKVNLFTAHLMGGCSMGGDERNSVVDSSGRHHQLAGLSVLDGSLFPTSLVVNPQLSIYSIVGKLATELSAELQKG